MTVVLSEAAANAMLETLAAMMNGGSIELMSDDERVLAVLKLSNPAAKDADSGQLAFNPIAEEDAALARGQAVAARILSSDGEEIFQCDIGDENSDAVIRLNTTQIFRNSPVRIRSFLLVMPS